MRSIVKTRIGPVPISLVAVLALAAFISAGLWLVPNGNQNAEAQSMKHVIIDVAEPIVSADAIELTSDFNRVATGDSVAYAVTRLDDDMVARTPRADGTVAGTDDDVDLGTLATGSFTVAPSSANDNMALITLDGTANMPGTRYVYVTATYTPGSDGTAQDPKILVFKITVIQDPIRQSGVEISNPNLWLAETGETATAITWDIGSGACEVVTNGAANIAGLSSREYPVDADANTATANVNRRGHLTGTNNLVSGGDCTTTGDSVDVVFKNTDKDSTPTGDTHSHLVYVTGGSMYTSVMPQLGKGGYKKEVVTLKAANALDYADQKITVSKSMADKMGVVYLIGYGQQTTDALELTSTSTTFTDASAGGNTNADFVVMIQFVGAVDAGKSEIAAPESIAEDATTATVTVTVNDDKGIPVKGTNVDFRLVNADAEIMFDNDRQVQLGQSGPDGTKSAMIEGLPKTDPIRVEVEITIGSGADAIKKTVYLIREGDPAMASISGYSTCNKKDGCAEATDEMPIVKATGESFLVRAMTTDAAGNDLSDETDAMLMVVGYDDDSVDAISVNSTATDGADDTFTVETWWEALNCEQMNMVIAGEPMGNDPAVGTGSTSPYCKHHPDADSDPDNDLSPEALAVVERAAKKWFMVTINDGVDYGDEAAGAGMYSVKATAGEGDDMVSSESKVAFTVLGGIDTITVTGPERLGTSQIVEGFSVTATADGGGVPGNIKGQKVTITFAPEDAASVVGTTDDTVTLDAMGTVRFSILITPSRLGNDNLIVIASHGTGDGQTISDPLEVSHRQVSTGPTNAAPTTVGSVADITMMIGDAPVTVTAGFADSDGDTLGYSASSDTPDVATAMSNGGGSVTVTAVGVGTADITVTASDGRAQATQTFMVTVSEVPDMTLGTASGLTATGGDGSVTLSWMPGNNATMYYVAGVAVMDDGSYDYSKNVWMSDDLPAADDSGMVSITISMTSDGMGLVNGTQYAFFVLSARMMDGMLEWTDWSNLARATPMAAGSGSPSNPF